MEPVAVEFNGCRLHTKLRLYYRARLWLLHRHRGVSLR